MVSSPLKEVANVFLRLGCTAFGGPVVHIAMMEREIVEKRKWMSREHFMDLIGATNLIPGPNSTEMAMHCGHERSGWRGLFVAGICFIGPAVLITGVLAWAYQHYGTLPEVYPFIYGIKPAIIAVITALMISLGRKAIKTLWLGAIAVIAAVLVIFGVSEIAVLFGAGFIGICSQVISKPKSALSIYPIFLVMSPTASGVANIKLFLIFLKIGAILYGSGYVLFAFLEDEFVTRGLLTKEQLIDAIAVGQFTPGPVFSSATFVGWQIGGWEGAIVASIGIFLPSFLFVAFLNPLIPRLRKSSIMSAFLDCVNVASVAIIAAVILQIGSEVVRDWKTILIAVLSFIVTFLFQKLNTAWVILGGALVGYILFLL